MLRLFCTLLSLAPLAAQPSVMRLVAVADASADADQPTVNFGSATIVTSGKTYVSTPTFRVWMTRGHYQFDLSPLAGLPLPDRVRLRLYQEQSSAAGCLDVTLHRVTAPWTESTLTWQNKPSHDPAVVARVCVGDSFDPGFKDFDVTALVHDWLNGTVPNHGLVVRDPTESTAGAARPLHATSREGANAAQHPHLEVAWGTLPFGNGCGTSANVPTLDLNSGSPSLGGTYELITRNLTRQSAVVHLLGGSDSTWNGVPLPLNLGFLGYPACDLLVAPDAMLPGTTNTRGEATLAIQVPNVPFLRGRSIYHQTIGVSSTLVLSFSNGFRVRAF